MVKRKTAHLLKIGFFASHNGTDMHGIITAIDQGLLSAIPAVVISNNSDAKALSFAKKRKIPSYHMSSKTHGEGLDRAIRDTLQKHGVDLVILSGYMRKIGPLTLQAFPEKILNVHPSLLPKYAGIYGDHVHQVVLQSGDKETGLTIHFINKEYDQGKILLQVKMPVLPTDTVETLRKKVQEQEIKSFIKLLSRWDSLFPA